MKVFYDSGMTFINYGNCEERQIIKSDMSIEDALILAHDAHACFDFATLELSEIYELSEAIAMISETFDICEWLLTFDKLNEYIDEKRFHLYNFFDGFGISNIYNILKAIVDDQDLESIEYFCDYNFDSYVVAEILKEIDKCKIECPSEMRQAIEECAENGREYLDKYLDKIDEGIKWIDVTYEKSSKETWINIYASVNDCNEPYCVCIPNTTEKFAERTDEKLGSIVEDFVVND